ERADGELLQVWVAREIERFEQMGPALRRRVIDGFERFKQNLLVFEAAIGALGERARVAAQLGTLLACAETLLSDEVIGAEAAAALVKTFAIDDITGHADEDDHNDCLAHLLTTQVRVELEHQGERNMTIAELIGRRHHGWADRELRRLGLAVLPAKISDQ